MPRNNNKNNVAPDIYKITKRLKMGQDAQTKNLTEELLEQKCSTFQNKKQAIQWIINNGDKNYVYIVRNRKNVMITSYCWKPNKKEWGSINNDKYYGGYKIGNPGISICHVGPKCCGCVASNCPQHRSTSISQL